MSTRGGPALTDGVSRTASTAVKRMASLRLTAIWDGLRRRLRGLGRTSVIGIPYLWLLAFFLIVVTLTPFAVGPNAGTLSIIAAGILWLGALLSCLVSLDRILASPVFTPYTIAPRLLNPEEVERAKVGLKSSVIMQSESSSSRAGAIGGGILGGYLTSVLANITSSENLLFVAAG